MAAEDPVDYATHQAAVREKKEALDARDAAQVELGKLRVAASLAEKQATQIQALKEQLAAQATESATTLALSDAGVTDPEDRAHLLFAHSRIPEADRLPIGESLAAWREDPNAAPSIAQVILGKAEGAADESGGAEGGGGPKRPPAPDVNGGGARGPGDTPASFTLDQINSAGPEELMKMAKALSGEHPELAEVAGLSEILTPSGSP